MSSTPALLTRIEMVLMEREARVLGMLAMAEGERMSATMA